VWDKKVRVSQWILMEKCGDFFSGVFSIGVSVYSHTFHFAGLGVTNPSCGS